MRKNIYNFSSKIEEYQKILDSHTAEVTSDDSPPNCSIEINNLNHYRDKFNQEICKKATHYLGEIEKNKNVPQYIEDGCKYFFYWLQVEVLKDETLGSKILMFYQEVLNEYEKTASNEEFPKYLNIINEHDIQNFIDIVDMYKNFYDFKKDKEESGKDKCSYADKCFRLYNKNIEVCKAGSDYDFCYELDNFRNEYNKYMKENIQCEDSLKILPSYRTYDTVVITTIPCVIIFVACLFFFLYKVNKTYFLNI
ncbi:VIR protein [Plasmodium vivax]|uniref:VIR protein n=1 Tax=Plasmodium vivax TaxID=5855 RepID=A0A1G4ECU7_PLAVI|nr:VIR protein [Plasmodium vivax]